MKLQRLTPILFFVSMLFFVGGNTFLPLTDPVESNYALTAKEMVESGNWLSPQIYGQFWYDKPIMIYWLIALCYKIWYSGLGSTPSECLFWGFVSGYIVPSDCI